MITLNLTKEEWSILVQAATGNADHMTDRERSVLREVLQRGDIQKAEQDDG